MKKYAIFSSALAMLLCLTFLFNCNFSSYADTISSLDTLSAKSFYLVDFASNELLAEKNSTERLPVASIVKLMTIHLTCKEIESGRLKIDEPVLISQNASSMGGSQVFIESGTTYTVGDLLKSTIISSANDASVALAEKIAGSEEEFVVLMNKTAKELNLENTNYVNCTGLPTAGQFSCAKDTAVLLKNVIAHQDYHKFSTIWMDKLQHPKGRESELVNTNKLIRYFEGCDGGKTGSTSEAGYCLASTAKRGDMRLIGVILGAKNGKARFAESSKLLNYGFGNFETKKVVSKDNPLEENVKVGGGNVDEISVSAEEDLFVLSKKHEEDGEIKVEIKINQSIPAPIKKGDVVGEIFVTKFGKIVAKTNIISNDSVAKSGYFDNFAEILRNWTVVNG